MTHSIPRVIAIDPTPQGFAYAVLEGSEFLVDWGLFHAPKGDLKCCRTRFEVLRFKYLPEILVLEDVDGSRRGRRARRMVRLFMKDASQDDTEVLLVSRKQVREAFSVTGFTKAAIAREIALRFPELARKLPKARRLWESEVERMSIFDALSFALTALGIKTI